MTTRVPIRVMVVDDSLDHRALMARRLERAGMAVSEAATADEALAAAQSVDLVLLDYRLPGVSGLELLRSITALRRGPSVVLVTAMGSTDVAVEAMREGAVDYVTKGPDYLDELPQVIERAWRTHDLEQRAHELQRLALLMHSASEREEVVTEIVEGASALLRAGACVLVIDDDGRRVAAQVGSAPAAVDDLRRRSTTELPEPGEVETAVDGADLVVALPADAGEPRGYLGVFGRDANGPLGEELELAKAFGAFAGTALRNLRRRELETSLIDELQRTVEARHDFIASVSHELRTPLTSISGYSETLLQRWADVEDDRKRDLLSRVLSNSRELGRLVEELIDLAALERGRRFTAQVRAIGLEEAMHRALDTVEVYTREREVDVDLVPATIEVDPDMFSRVMANLISNAVKYSPAGRPVRIRVARAGGHVRIEVEDEGVGLDSHEVGRVFEPFWRAGSAVANAIRGSGIGLSLVREYVRTLGGQIGVESEPGMGSTFWFTVPLADGDDSGASSRD
ncbi:MAG: ATP-binding protein [Nitriliruptorales bacterium]|nr:ATP-binding protein [Nitriliruptorales bacterium]